MRTLLTICLLSLLSGCAPSNTYYNWVSSEHDFKRFDKIAVFGITRDLQDASDFEVAMVNNFRKEGYKAIQGMSVIPPEWMKSLDVKAIRQHLLSKGVEVVVSLAAVDASTRTIYVPDAAYRIPQGRSRFGSYYLDVYEDIYQPGYYTQLKTYIYEGHVYDLTLEDVDRNMIWTYQYKFEDQAQGIPPLAPFAYNLTTALKRDEIF